LEENQPRRRSEEIVVNQLNDGIVERAPEQPTGERLFYMPHKPVVKEDATTTKVRMVFDASIKPHPMLNSVSMSAYSLVHLFNHSCGI
jgi:hypothetical protein